MFLLAGLMAAPVAAQQRWPNTPAQRNHGRRDGPNERADRFGRYNYGTRIAFDKGYQDGLQKGRDDAHGHRDADPVRHSWYRSGTRGYDNDYGSKERYRNTYRDGFEQGYMTAYRRTYRR
jgi:hypothetical protein